MHELCILFLYHQCDDLTRRHLESLIAHNPEAVVVPLTDSVSEHLPNTVDVGKYDDGWTTSSPWMNVDVTVYKWFKHRAFDAKRYILIEYDCYCNVDLAKYYNSVWDADVAGVDFFSFKENPNWAWFRHKLASNVPLSDRPFASGLCPFVCTLFSHSALEKIVANASKQDIFCELRLATTIRKLNLKFERLPFFKRTTICWHEYPWKISRPGLYHSIKSTKHNEEKASQPNRFSMFFLQRKREKGIDRSY